MNNDALTVFHCEIIDRIRKENKNNVWALPGGQLRLPEVFGFCRGVKRALAMAAQAAERHKNQHESGNMVLLGEIIHNPWVNDYFRSLGVTILSPKQRNVDEIDKYIKPDDCAIIPAFGAVLPLENRLRDIGCKIIDCSCGDVIRLWRWSEKAVRDGYSVLIFGRSMHDETIVTKSRLDAAGGKFLVVETLDQLKLFCDILTGKRSDEFSSIPTHATNAKSIDDFNKKLAQVSQTTMLYDETMIVQTMLRNMFVEKFGSVDDSSLLLQPTVCQATQARQNAAVELCKSGSDLAIVVGGFTSSNTRHLYELAGNYSPAYLIEGDGAIISEKQLLAWDNQSNEAKMVDNWLDNNRPLNISILAGASTPEIVIGKVLEKLARFLK